MKQKIYLICEALMIVAVTGLSISFWNGFLATAVLCKSAASFFFVLAGILGYIINEDNWKFSRFMLAAFICCMVGDVFLALDSSGVIFVIGVASFAVAHVLFAFAFCRVCRFAKVDFIVAVSVFAVSVLLLCVGDFEFQGLFPVLIGYAAVISFMVAKALSMWRCRQAQRQGTILIMVGGVLFLLSDVLLLFWLFGVGVAKEVQVVNWVLYYLAQACLTAALNKEWKIS